VREGDDVSISPVASTQSSARPAIGFAVLLLLLVVLGFGLNLALHPQIISGTTEIHHLHALAMLAWFALLLGQPVAITRSSIEPHRFAGRLSPILALGVIGSGISIMRFSYLYREGTPIAALDAFVLVNFTIFYLIAIFAVLRAPKAIDTHQRMMLLSGVSLTPPAVARLAAAIGLNLPTTFGLSLLIAFSVMGYDLLVGRRLRPEGVIGGLMITGGLIAGLAIGETQWWAKVLEGIWGQAEVVT